MKAFAISTFLFLLAAKLNAAPTSNARQFEAQLTFEGAPPDVAFYTLSAPTDGSVFHICLYPPTNHLSSNQSPLSHTPNITTSSPRTYPNQQRSSPRTIMHV